MRTEFRPIPVGGINASVPLDLMPSTDAEDMVNFLPREKKLEFRKGSLIHTDTALGGPIETLATHRAEDATETLLIAADANIYSINLSTGVTTSEGSGYSNNRWQTTNINNMLLLVNGEDAPQQYDGATLGNYTSALTGTSFTATDVKGVVSFKGRAIYWENNAAKFWYCAASAYGGTVTSFPLAYTTQEGGYVVECCTWSRDSGAGSDDLFVVIMSTGETLVYEGSDPASNFVLIGRFTLGAPLSIRGSTQLASDRIILTQDGWVNLSTALQVGRATDKGNVSSKIVDIVKNLSEQKSELFGWEIFYHDKQSLLIVNVPIYIDASDDELNIYHQYCMNTNTGAWTRFTGWNAITFSEIGGELYMGGSDGHLRKCFVGASDDGTAIDFKLVPAFTMMESPSNKKKLCFVVLTTNFVNKNKIGIGGLHDFDPRAYGNAQPSDIQIGNTADWDDSYWDEDYWGEISSSTIEEYIYPVSTSGYSISVKINIKSDVQTASIYSMRYKYQMMRTI